MMRLATAAHTVAAIFKLKNGPLNNKAGAALAKNNPVSLLGT